LRVHLVRILPTVSEAAMSVENDSHGSDSPFSSIPDTSAGSSRPPDRAPATRETWYQAALETLPDGFWLCDQGGRILEVNDAYVQRSGYSRGELLTLRLEDLEDTKTPAETTAHLEQIRREGSDTYQTTHRAKHGVSWPVEINASYRPIDGGRVFMHLREITERRKTEENLRKRAEARLSESEERFRSIFEKAIDGIMIADAETKRHIEANPAMCAMLGYTREEITSLSVDDIHPHDALPAVREVFESQLRGELAIATEIPMLRKDGSVIYADISATHLTLDGRQCLAGIFREITERKRAYAALRQREKQLAESQRIAHIGSWEHNLTTGEVVWSDERIRPTSTCFSTGSIPTTDPP
jgi:PAS domain S-box-containing protein